MLMALSRRTNVLVASIAWMAEADFFSRRAVQLSPQDSEVAGIQMQIENRIKELRKQ